MALSATVARTIAPAPMQDHFKGEDFSSLLDETLGQDTSFDGSVVTGRILRLTDEYAIVDVGLKSEGRIALKEFGPPGSTPELKPGDTIELYVERYEDKDGSIILSREKARREEAWTNLEKAFETQQRVSGTIYGRVKGGFTVDLGGAVAFLPGSQVDIRPVRDVTPLMGSPQPFQILKMDRARGNTCRTFAERCWKKPAPNSAQRTHPGPEGRPDPRWRGEEHHRLRRGSVDLGGVDGLLHVTDISLAPHESIRRKRWKIGQHGQGASGPLQRRHPAHQPRYKQPQADPWEGVAAKYPPGAKYTGRVTNITDYGAFVELEPGVEGLAHVSEMLVDQEERASRKKIIATSQEVDVVVLDVDSSKRRILHSAQQVQRNPVEQFVEEHPIGLVRKKAKSATSPNSACSSACPPTSTA